MLPDQSPPAKVWTLQENPWGIPGGIANRFGRKALEEMAQSAAETPIEIPEEPEPEAETQVQADLDMEPTEPDQSAQDASEREEDAARITIELQSH